MPQPYLSATPYIIAEVGASHERDINKALYLIDVTASVGAQAVKFQVYDAERLARRRHAEGYKSNYTNYQLPLDWLPGLAKRAHANKIDLVLSVYDRIDLEHALPYADILKIASFEASDLDLVQACTATGKPVIVSAGMMTAEDRRQLKIETSALVLHCVSAYPTQMEDLHLSTIRAFGLAGFSDHTANVITGALAVMAGAHILEVHVKLFGQSRKNPDSLHSLTPDQFAQYVANAQDAQAAIGMSKIGPLPCEAACVPFQVRAKEQAQ
jgi:sialic acid synthase SpsE